MSNNYSKVYTVFENIKNNKDGFNEFTGTLNEICQHFNIKYSTLMMRIKNRGNISIEEAITMKPYDNIKSIITVFKDTNIEYTSNKKDICKHFNVNYNTVMHRISNAKKNNVNITFDEAILLTKEKYRHINNNNDNNIKIVYKNDKNGREFIGNLTEISKHFNINYKKLTYRISKGMTIEEAIEYLNYNDNNDNNNNNSSSSINTRDLNIDNLINNAKTNIYIAFRNDENRKFKGTRKEIAEHFNIDYQRFIYNISKLNMSLDKAIEHEENRKKNNYNYGRFKY